MRSQRDATDDVEWSRRMNLYQAAAGQLLNENPEAFVILARGWLPPQEMASYDDEDLGAFAYGLALKWAWHAMRQRLSPAEFALWLNDNHHFVRAERTRKANGEPEQDVWSAHQRSHKKLAAFARLVASDRPIRVNVVVQSDVATAMVAGNGRLTCRGSTVKAALNALVEHVNTSHRTKAVTLARLDVRIVDPQDPRLANR